MPDNHKTLEAYIQKLLSIKDKLREDDLRSIAAEMGFTEHEWNLLQDECEDHLQRGEGFAQYENWDDAIVELNQALAINPLHHEVLDQLSIAHYRRYLERQRPNDKLLSIQYAEKILDDDPGHKPSLQRISALKKGAVVSSPRKTPAKSSPRTAYIALFIGLALAMMGGLLTFLFVSVEPELPSGTDTPEVATVPESSPASSSPAGSEAAISLLKHPQGKHFALTTDVAELNPYIDSYSFKYRGLLEVKDLEVSELKMTITVYDLDGEIFLDERRDILSSHEPVHRRGDFIPVSFDLFEQRKAPEGFSRVTLSLGAMEVAPAASTYDPSPVQTFAWNGKQPPNVDIQVRERFSSISSPGFGGGFAEYAWEVENTGNVSIKSLKLRIQRLDQDGGELGYDELWIVSSSEPILKIGEKRLAGGTYGLDKSEQGKVDGYRLELVSIGL